MTIDDKIRDEKLQHDINRESATISVLSSSISIKYECLTGEKTLLSNQREIIKQAKFAYSPLEKLLKSKQKQLNIKAKIK